MSIVSNAESPLGVGLVGIGWMGRLHTRSLRRLRDHYPELPSCRFVVAADALPQREQEARAVLGYERFTTDWREVVADPEVQVVCVGAPNALHQEVCVAAARAGKHVWGEKPLGRNAEETTAIATAARDAKVATTVGFNYRHAPLVEHIATMIAAGELGRLTRVHGHFLADYASSAEGAFSWRFQRAAAGSGALGDLMSHVVDLVEHLTGPVERVVAQQSMVHTHRPAAGDADSHFAAGTGELVEVENEDHVTCLTRSADGVAGIVEVGRSLVGPHVSMGIELHGTEASVSWDFQRMNEMQLYTRTASGEQGYATVYAAPRHGEFARFQPGVAIGMGYDDLKVIEASRLVRSIVDGAAYGPTFDDAARAATVIAAMERSVASGRWETVR